MANERGRALAAQRDPWNGLSMDVIRRFLDVTCVDRALTRAARRGDLEDLMALDQWLLQTKARTLPLDASVDALVIGSDGREWLSTGLPVDRIDVLVVASVDSGMYGTLSALQPYCKGEVIVSHDAAAATA